MERLQPHKPGDLDLHGARQPARQRPHGGELRYRGGEHVCRWLADESNELDRVVVRTWN
jgi:hypothetical protein